MKITTGNSLNYKSCINLQQNNIFKPNRDYPVNFGSSDFNENPVSYTSKNITGTRHNLDFLFQLNNRSSEKTHEQKESGILRQISTLYRKKVLKRFGIPDFFSGKIAALDKNCYNRALELIKAGVPEECVETIACFEDKKYKQAIDLIQNNIKDENLPPLADLDEDKFILAKDLRQKGIDTDCIILFTDLKEDEYNKALTFLEKGYTPVEAAYLAKLTPKQTETALLLMAQNTGVEIAAEIALLDENMQQKCFKLLQKGITPDEVIQIAALDDCLEPRIDELNSLNIGDENIEYIAKLDDKLYSKALSLLEQGVLPEFIADIISIEEGESENPEYFEYRKRGYSYSSSFALSLLADDEIKALIKLIKNNPAIKELFKENYDINLILLQDSGKAEAILSREIRTKDGTKITIVQTFDEDSNHTKSRLEEYSNHATSSTLESPSDVYRLKYDKYGEIREMTQLIQDPETHEVTGVIFTKASAILQGAFESTYYDINDIKTGTSIDNNEAEMDIEQAVTTSGKPISSVKQNKDGSITYTENFTVNDCNVKRNYTEKKDDNGQITYSAYTYKITDTNDNIKMDINRTYQQNADGTITNTINGIEYHIHFDDETKEITISDGQNTRIVKMKDKLSFYSGEIQWQALKNLPADIIITMDKNINKWNYCRNEDATADGYSNILSSGVQQNIIQHETGHFIDYEKNLISDNKDLQKIYSKEMAIFHSKVPYNEQEFIQYFSPRADLTDSVGNSEFLAESNILFTSYGTNYQKLKTRPFLLARYFPNTIAKIAQLCGKTSTKSLLE